MKSVALIFILPSVKNSVNLDGGTHKEQAFPLFNLTAALTAAALYPPYRCLKVVSAAFCKSEVVVFASAARPAQTFYTL